MERILQELKIGFCLLRIIGRNPGNRQHPLELQTTVIIQPHILHLGGGDINKIGGVGVVQLGYIIV